MAPLDPAIESLLKDSSVLIPAIVQDVTSRDVLMLAYMNTESLALTLTTGKATYWSRSRKELWIKGATSGHFQEVQSVALDCDGDALLIIVKQIGVACHTGNATCFHTPLDMK
ncbi:MAG: phosphoribosyl-AMP cyclohydrolase [Candidatus Planktophila sp.]